MNTKHTQGPKIYFVPWEGYSSGSQPNHRDDLDRLCLQGPHTLERATELSKEIRNAGFLASVIECSQLKALQEINPEAVPEMLELLKETLEAETGRNKSFRPGLAKKILAAIAKAEGNS